MTTHSFFARLALVTGVAGAGLTGLHFLAAPAQVHWRFSLAALALFAVICAGLFFMGRNAAHSTNKHAFTNLVSVSVFGKMLVAVGFLLAYRAVAKPANEWFVGIFLGVYVIYTAFEVWFMTRLAKSSR